MDFRLMTAAAAAASLAASAMAGGVRVSADQTTAVKLTQAAKTVLIGNPMIAEATMIDEKTIYVMGRMVGQTNLVAVDQNGNEIFNEQVSVRVGDQHIVTLHKGNTGPRTFSCAPKCEWMVMPGDTSLKDLQDDVSKKQQVSDEAANIATKQR